jgi:hypothetical protein
MTAARPAFCDDVTAFVDVIDVSRFHLVVRDRATGAEHSFSYDNILIGSNKDQSCYEIVMPAWLAQMEGITDAR